MLHEKAIVLRVKRREAAFVEVPRLVLDRLRVEVHGIGLDAVPCDDDHRPRVRSGAARASIPRDVYGDAPLPRRIREAGRAPRATEHDRVDEVCILGTQRRIEVRQRARPSGEVRALERVRPCRGGDLLPRRWDLHVTLPDLVLQAEVARLPLGTVLGIGHAPDEAHAALLVRLSLAPEGERPRASLEAMPCRHQRGNVHAEDSRDADVRLRDLRVQKLERLGKGHLL